MLMSKAIEFWVTSIKQRLRRIQGIRPGVRRSEMISLVTTMRMTTSLRAIEPRHLWRVHTSLELLKLKCLSCIKNSRPVFSIDLLIFTVNFSVFNKYFFYFIFFVSILRKYFQT